MFAFFRSRRRIAGCVSLAFALILTGIWARSELIADVVVLKRGILQYDSFLSFRGQLKWHRFSDVDAFSLKSRWYSEAAVRTKLPDQFASSQMYHWRWHLGGFDVGNEPLIHGNRFFLHLSCIELVIPLVLLSAWLLLVNPQKPKGMLKVT